MSRYPRGVTKIGGGRGSNQHAGRRRSVARDPANTLTSKGFKQVGVDLSDAHMNEGEWPPAAAEAQVWEWHGERPSSRLDRLFRDYASAVPPLIADLDLRVDRAAGRVLNDANAAIIALESDRSSHFTGVAGALLRSESVGSSKIEQLDVRSRELGLAAIGEARTSSVPAQVWANVAAMNAAIDAASGGEIDVESIHGIHRALMRDDPYEGEWAGRARTEQNWIGGSDTCPRDALFVPPAPDRVDALLRDLAGWCRRDDVPPLAQAAITHAQFETIHPYTDGNGRTGRALIHTVLRRRGLTPTVIVPTSSALLADVSGYFAALDTYRSGNVNGYLATFAGATARAATEARSLGAELRFIADEWQGLAKPRTDSATARLLDGLLQQPVISASTNAAVGRADTATIYRSIDRLEDLGILTELTEYRRNRIWVATQVTDAMDEFARRIGRRQDRR